MPPVIKDELPSFLIKIELSNYLTGSRQDQTMGLWSRYTFDYNYTFYDIPSSFRLKAVENNITIGEIVFDSLAEGYTTHFVENFATFKLTKDGTSLTVMSIVLEHVFVDSRTTSMTISKIFRIKLLINIHRLFRF